MYVFSICTFMHLYTHGMAILQDALILPKVGNWKIWRDLFAGKAFPRSFTTCKQISSNTSANTFCNMKLFFFYFQKKKNKSKLSKIWFASIMKQKLNWSGLNWNEFLQKFAETYVENFLHLPQKTICSLPKHKNSLIGILKIFNS